MRGWNTRKQALLWALLCMALLAAVAFAGMLLTETAVSSDFTSKNIPPCGQHLFGTDWMGRDMLARTLAGLFLSIRLGLLASVASGGIALTLALAAALLGRYLDAGISWLIDLVMGIPHILLVMLISMACGRGLMGVMVGISLTHWTVLARVLRSEAIQLREAVYIRTAQKLGARPIQLAIRHYLPHLLPQLLTGIVLQFPHAMIHEASVTFLGFGLPPEQPAIGVILAESMGYLTTGKWWLAVFPGLALMLTVLLFAELGDCVQRLLSPVGSQR